MKSEVKGTATSKRLGNTAIHSPAMSSVTTSVLSKAGDSEAGGVVRMAVFGLLSLQVLSRFV